MKIAALIPARGGSERLPFKNLAEVAGVPLVVRSIDVAKAAGIEQIYVSTNDRNICDLATSNGAKVHHRDSEQANGRQEPDRVIELWWRALPLEERPDVIVFMHCTYPLTSGTDVRDCISLLLSNEKLDVVHTAVQSHTHHFAGRLRAHADGAPMLIADRPPGERPRTQTLGYRAHEGGGVWTMRREHWERTKSRDAVYWRASQVIIPSWREVDIDTLEELEVVRAIVDRMGWPE